MAVKVDGSARTSRKGRRRRGLRDFAVLMMVMIFIAFAVVFVKQQYEMSKLRNEKQQLMQQIEVTRAEQKRAEEEKKKLSEPQYIEQVAREQGMTKPGEIPYISNGKKNENKKSGQ